jgi:hypothetical protein
LTIILYKETLFKNASQIRETETLIENVDFINRLIQIVKFLSVFESNLVKFNEAIKMKSYDDCYVLLVELNELNKESNSLLFQKNDYVDNPDQDNKETKELFILNELKEDFVVCKEKLWYEIGMEWDSLIKIEPSKIYVLKSIDSRLFEKFAKLSEFSSTNGSTGSSSFLFTPRLSQFGKKFINLCESNIVNLEHTCDISYSHDAEYKILEFKPANNENSHDPTQLLEYKLNQVTVVLKFLHENMFNLRVNAQHDIMSIFSNLFFNSFIESVYKQIVINVIPLTDFDSTIESKFWLKVESFENELNKMNFHDAQKTSPSGFFKSFLQDVEELYVRKKCKHLIESAQESMKNVKLLFETQKLDDEQLSLKGLARQNPINYIQKMQHYEEKLAHLNAISSKNDLNIIRMNSCSVSILCKELLQTVYKTFNEALEMIEKSHNAKNIALLCLVARNLIDLYANVVLSYHAEKLESLPTLSAIVFNDLNYLSYNCLLITSKYSDTLIKTVQDEKGKHIGNHQDLLTIEFEEIFSNFSCLDLVEKLTSSAQRLFDKQLKIQQVNLIQFLNEDSNGLKDLSLNNNYEMLKRSLEKCMIQLNNLSTLWISILPNSFFLNTFGYLFELVCSDLIKSVICLEDIASDDAKLCISAFEIVEKAVYNLISKQIDSNGVEMPQTNVEKMLDFDAAKLIKSWNRFKYLKVILDSNLQGIDELWSDGLGPLALNFTSEELRSLIRALFMITDRRQALLAKII